MSIEINEMGILLDALKRFVGDGDPYSEPGSLTPCTLSELCPGIKDANIPKTLRGCDMFGKIGEWRDEGNKFTLSLGS